MCSLIFAAPRTEVKGQSAICAALLFSAQRGAGSLKADHLVLSALNLPTTELQILRDILVHRVSLPFAFLAVSLYASD